MERRLFTIGFVSLVVCTGMLSKAHAGLGAKPITPEEFEAAPPWRPDPQGVGEMPRFDLRDELPPVGNQGRRQSCVGWATAYACKTYLEVMDQGWQPDSPRRIFSPSFIYSQLNNGIDRGSNPLHAFSLLKNNGWGTSLIRAQVTFDNGGVQNLSHHLRFQRVQEEHAGGK